MLYELLSGALPFDGHDLRQAGLAEIQRRIREVEPVRPSARVPAAGGPDDSGASTAVNRCATVRGLRRALEGDLDWIVLKAMAKEPARRYQSPSALAEDLSRYLDDRPVLAGPPSRLYLLRKFVVRNRVRVAVAGSLGLALLVAGTAWWAIREDAAQQLRAASGRVDDAIVEIQRLAAIAAAGDTDDPQPWRHVRAELSLARDLARDHSGLVARIDRIESAVDAGYAAAESRSRQGQLEHETRRRLLEIPLPEQVGRGRVYDPKQDCERRIREYGQVFAAYGVDATGAVEVVARAVETSPLRDELLVAFDDLAMAHQEFDRPAEARRLRQIARAVGDDPWRRRFYDLLLEPRVDRDAIRRLAAEIDPSTLSVPSLVVLARQLWDRQAPRAPGAEKVIALLSAGFRAHPDSQVIALCLGMLCRDRSDPEAARAWLRTALALQPDSLVVLEGLGEVALELQDVAEAEHCFRRVLQRVPDHVHALGNLAGILANTRRMAEAATCYEAALRQQPDSPVLLGGFGTMRLMQGKLQDAEDLLRRSVTARENNPHAWFNLGNVYLARGGDADLEAAAEAFTKATEQMPDKAEAWCYLGQAQARLGRYAEAVPALRRGHELGRKQPGWSIPSRLWLAQTIGLWGDQLNQRGEIAQAIEKFREVNQLAPEEPHSWYALGTVLGLSGDLPAATDVLREGVRRTPDAARNRVALGWVLGEAGRFAEALEALESCRRLSGKGSALPEDFEARITAMQQRASREAELLRVATGRLPVADAETMIGVVSALQLAGEPVWALQLCGEAMQSMPEAAAGLHERFGYLDARAAAAVGGHRPAPAALSPVARTLREQSLIWFRASLQAFRDRVDHGDRQGIARTLRIWQTDPALVCVRDAPLADEADGAAWQALWRDVQALREALAR